MRQAAADSPPLRLAGAARPGRPPGPAPVVRPAPGLEPGDARWTLAVLVAESIEGGHRAMLRPERRERLHRAARAMGLRAFDAGLIIAIVQDGFRRGDVLGPDTERRLTMVREPAVVEPSRWDVLLAVVASAALVVAILAFVMHG